LVCHQASTPFAAGLFQPVIVLPAWVLKKLLIAELSGANLTIGEMSFDDAAFSGEPLCANMT
jgi:hypothetical protein